MYQNCGGIQLQSFGFEAHFKMGGQLNEEMKFLQQVLPHLGLWFKVYIGSSVSFYVQ